MFRGSTFFEQKRKGEREVKNKIKITFGDKVSVSFRRYFALRQYDHAFSDISPSDFLEGERSTLAGVNGGDCYPLTLDRTDAGRYEISQTIGSNEDWIASVNHSYLNTKIRKF